MNQSEALAVLESLSSGVRLDVFRLLVRAGPDGAVAGEIASALALAPSNLSFHLRTLTHARLLTVEQEGRFQRYRADLTVINGLIGFLTENCCEGFPEKCATALDARSRVAACLPTPEPDPESHA